MSAPSFQTVVSNWRLLLLGSTGVVLSIASGWTTWDGMRNFTKEPLLSLMITFGIQGVMLIAAWLIGESFATGKVRQLLKRGGGPAARLQVIAGTGIGILLFLALGLLLLIYFDVFSQDRGGLGAFGSWGEKVHELRFAILAALIVALFFAAGGRDALDDYLRSFRVIVRNAVLWVIFLVCMATSVFFSFDSLFSTIFSESERRRAADLRTQSEVGSLVTDIVALTEQRRLEQRTALLNGGAWLGYARTLDQLATDLKAAPAAIDRHLQKGLQDEQERAARRHAELSQVEKERLQLTKREAALTAQIRQSQQKAEQLTATVETLNRQIFETDRQIIAKGAEAEAEARGIGVTSRVGRGPKFRELAEEHRRLKETKSNLELQLRGYTERLEATRKEIVGPASELAGLKSTLLQLEGRASTARNADGTSRRTGLADALRTETQAALRRLESDRIAFEQSPTRAGLDALQSRCAKTVGVLSGAPMLTTEVAMSACDPGTAHEAAAQLYALNGGAAALAANCSADKSQASGADVEAQLALARSCLRLSGLPTTDVGDMRESIDALARNRDDKAHRFVVTTNAFTDGNRLAYLALAIAIAIDALVFMSGLFGANAAHAPALAAPRLDRRAADQLAAMIESALLPNVFENATAALETIKPVAGSATPNPGADWTHELDLGDARIASPGRLRKILNAGVAVRAVQRDATRPEHYLLRSDFIAFLHNAAQRAFTSDRKNSDLSELKEIVGIALRPSADAHAGIVLNYLHPSSQKDGFSSQLILSEVAAKDLAIVRRCLNAASTLSCVHCDGPESDCDRYLLHKDLYRVLAQMTTEPPPLLEKPATEIPVFLPGPVPETVDQPRGTSGLAEPQTAGVEREPAEETIAQPGGEVEERQAAHAPDDRPAVETEPETETPVPVFDPIDAQGDAQPAETVAHEPATVMTGQEEEPAELLPEPTGDAGEQPSTAEPDAQPMVEAEPQETPDMPAFEPVEHEMTEQQAPLAQNDGPMDEAGTEETEDQAEAIPLFEPIGDIAAEQQAAPVSAASGNAENELTDEDRTAPPFEPIDGEAASNVQYTKTPEADASNAERSSPRLRYRGTRQSRQTPTATVKATLTSRTKTEKTANLKPTASRQRPRISITDDTITFD
ncbi:MAG: hypothetical protein MI824_20825 [Hyphomicrobiales bacterium]|nr:hypothetical protein [Hyphomicrobiales bacterium]